MRVNLDMTTDESKELDQLLNAHLSENIFGNDNVRITKMSKDESSGRYNIVLNRE